ncbi:MAG: RNA polymerase sigma factor FliA [Gammaproteobacteria bacterium]|nr:RNA polymerase sigma factor FliA [Gammaproteobacteria bacterium]
MSAVVEYARASRQSESIEPLIAEHATLVKRIAFHLKARLPDTVELDDLCQAGMLALLEAAAHFEAGHGACFATYAGIRIRGAMIDALRATDWAPRSVHRNTRAVAAALAAVEHRTGREARDTEIAAELKVSLDVYHRMVQDAAQCRWERLDELESLDPVDGREDPLRDLADSGLRSALTAAIEALPERERLLMSLYYGDEMNLKEIGVVLGVSESRVSQLHGQAVARLRARLAAWRDR